MTATIEVTALTPEPFESLAIREGILLDGETITVSCKGIRDMLILTSKRLLLVDKQGLTGKSKNICQSPSTKSMRSRSRLAAHWI